MKTKFLLIIVATAAILFYPNVHFAQAPTLGTAAGFALFTTTGAVTNTGITKITGNIGTNSGAITGFGNVNGVLHTGNAATLACSTDLVIAYNQLNNAVQTAVHAPLLGNGETLQAGVYAISGNTTLSNTLTLDANGDANAVFIFKIDAPFSTGASSQVTLVNGAQACNVFWKVEGAVNMAALTTMRGTVVANNAAIDMSAGVTLEGRALSTTGAITLNGVLAFTPAGCNRPLLTGPAAPVLGTTACYTLFSGNGALTNAGVSNITGDVGTNVGLTTGFDPLKVNGTIHPIPDVSTAACAADLLLVYNYLNNLPEDVELLYPAQFGHNLVLTPHTYILKGATSFTDSLYLDAQGNADGVFVIKINGALLTSTFAKVILINGAKASNVYWKVDGAVTISDFSIFKGTIIVNNAAVNLNTGVDLEGRALTTTGAFSTAAVNAYIAAPCAVLPLTLLSFNGTLQHATPVLNWKTSNEQNTAHFDIEVSTDGNRFDKVGTVAAAGNASEERSYSFTHRNNPYTNAPVLFYRLKMADRDNRFTYSNTIALQQKSNSTKVTLYPNPATIMATVSITVDKQQQLRYTLMDNAGKTLRSEKVNVQAGTNHIRLDTKTLSPGTYLLRLEGATTSEKIQFIKQ